MKSFAVNARRSGDAANKKSGVPGRKADLKKHGFIKIFVFYFRQTGLNRRFFRLCMKSLPNGSGVVQYNRSISGGKSVFSALSRCT